MVYFLTSQPADMMRFSLFMGTCLLISFVAQSVGLVVGAAMNVQNGVFLAPVMSVPFLLFSGFFVSFDAIPVYLRWITYLSYIRYGFEGTALTIYGFSREKLKCFQVGLTPHPGRWLSRTVRIISLNFLCIFLGVLPLQESGNDSGGTGHARRWLYFGYSRPFAHLRRSANRRVSLPALEDQDRPVDHQRACKRLVKSDVVASDRQVTSVTFYRVKLRR